MLKPLIALLLFCSFAQAKKGAPCSIEFEALACSPKLQLKQSLKSFAEKAGFEPEFWSPTKSVLKAEKPGSSEEIGKIVYFFLKKKTLEIDEIRVAEPYRRKGLSEIFLAKILEEHPEVKRIAASDLVDDNGAALKEALQKGNSCREAIMATAAYRMRARLGFSEFEGEPNCKTGEFTVVRP